LTAGIEKNVDEMNYFELLAWLGIGSSHPGGFPATKHNLENLQVSKDDYVLDAGCGSGLTACYLAKTAGCKIMGIDINPQMIEKARQRAEQENLSELLEFQVADVYDLTFPGNSFDLAMAESLTVFLDKVKVYKQFYRVLKPGGRLADLEMALVKELPPEIEEQMHQCFGPGTNPLSFQAWVDALQEAGFEYTGILNPQYLKPGSQLIIQELKQDWLLVKDLAEKVIEQPGLLGRLQKNAGFMRKNYGYFGFGMICGRKPLETRLNFLNRLRQMLNR